MLVRNTEVIPEFTAAFDAAGIPFVVNRGRGFYDSREVNDLTHLLRVIANPRDEISLAVVLRSPLVNVSDEALLRLKMNGEKLGGALAGWTAGVGDADHARLARFAAPPARVAPAPRIRHLRPPAARRHRRVRLPRLAQPG